jgi:hypothetical protein
MLTSSNGNFLWLMSALNGLSLSDDRQDKFKYLTFRFSMTSMDQDQFLLT